MKKLLRNPFEWKDLGGIALGAVPLGFPVAVTEEVWDLSQGLSLARALYLMFGCLAVISIFIYYL